jgi:hypothetical protein
MSAEANPQRAETTSWRPDLFTQPRTYPEKWDLSSFETPNLPAKNGLALQARSADEFDSSTADGGANWKPEPFPQPRTFPSHWDLSELE